jgi:hypothetical protein
MTARGDPPAGRRSRQPARRPLRVEFSLTEEEFDVLPPLPSELAWPRVRSRLRRRWRPPRARAVPVESFLREALAELIRASGFVRRIGVNLNQAVAKLNATGQRSGDLLPYAIESLRRSQQLDAAAEAVRKRLP